MNSAGSCRGIRGRCGRVGAALILAAALATPQAAAQEQRQAAPLRDLVQEAEQNNPTIAASVHAWQASTHVPAQARALPGPELTLQQFSVGSPRPFAGFGDSSFAYIAAGVSQELPYPGKRALRGEVARREADSLHAHSDAVKRQVVEALQLTYVQLAYIQQTLPILERHDRLLTQLQQIAESRYRVGQGNQQDVLKAQLQHTKILQDVATHHQDEGVLEAQLKQILNRSQDTPDIVAEPLTATLLPYSAAEWRQRVSDANPDVQARADIVRRERGRVDLAHKELKPDFIVQYMYQHTASQFPDYYMGTLGVRLPNRDRQRAALAEAEQEQDRATSELEAERQRVSADVQQQYVLIQSSSERLTIYRDGLMPQADATLQAGMAAYESNRQDFETLLSSFVDVLNIDVAYLRELAGHESAIARMERLIGAVRP
jgi:cobalt-zinc-cadmium efflux system outer membrane protein